MGKEKPPGKGSISLSNQSSYVFSVLLFIFISVIQEAVLKNTISYLIGLLYKLCMTFQQQKFLPLLQDFADLFLC